MTSYPIVSEPKFPNPGPPGGYAVTQVGGQTPGLEQLRNLQRISIHQKNSTCCRCWPDNSIYKVKNDKELLYHIEEDTSCLVRCVFGWLRSFEVHVRDSRQSEVMQFRRPLRCGNCYTCMGNWYYPCCLQEMEVFSPPGQLLGRIKQNFSLCTPSFTGLDAMGQPKFHVSGSFCRFPCFADLKFQILSSDNQTEVGDITKKWTNICKESCTNAHRFDITFPQTVDVKDKALILAAAILVDYQHFT